MSSGEEDAIDKAPTNPPTPRMEGLRNTAEDAAEAHPGDAADNSPAPVEEGEDRFELDEGRSEEGGVSLQSNAASRGLLGQTMIMKRRGRYWWIFHPLTIAGTGIVLPYVVEGFACLVSDSLEGASRLAAGSEDGSASSVVARPSRFVGFLGDIAIAALRQVQRFSPFDVESWGVFGSPDTWDREGYPPTPAWMLQQSASIPRSFSSLLVALREVLGISSLEAWRQLAMTFGGSGGGNDGADGGSAADGGADGGEGGAGNAPSSSPVDLKFSLPILLMGFSLVSLSAARWGYQRRRELAEGSPSSGDSDHSMEVGHTLDDGASTARDLAAGESRFGGSVYVQSELNGGLVGSRSQRDLELDTLNSLRRDSGALPLPLSGGPGSSSPTSPTDPDTSVRLTEKLLRLRETEVEPQRCGSKGKQQSPRQRDDDGALQSGVNTARRRVGSKSPDDDRASNASSEPTHGRPSGASQSSVPPFRYPDRKGATSTAATAGSGSNVASFYSGGGRRGERDADMTGGSDTPRGGSEGSSPAAQGLGSMHPTSAVNQRRSQDPDEDELPRTSRTRRRTPNPTDAAGAVVRRRGVSPQGDEGTRTRPDEIVVTAPSASAATSNKPEHPTPSSEPKRSPKATHDEEQHQRSQREEAFLREFEGTDIPYSTSRYSSSRASPNSALPPGFGAHLGATSVSRWAAGMLSSLNAETQDGNPLRPPQQPPQSSQLRPTTDEPASLLGNREGSAYSTHTLHSYQSGGNLAQHWTEEDLHQVNGRVSIALVSPCSTLDYESLVSMARKYRCQRVVLVPPGDGSLNASGSTSPDSKNGASSAARFRALQLSRAGIQGVNRPAAATGSQSSLNDSGYGLGGERDVDISRVNDVRAYVRRLSQGTSSSLVSSPLASRAGLTDSAARTAPPLSANGLGRDRGATATYPIASAVYGDSPSGGARGSGRIPTVAIHKTKTANAVPLHRFEHPPEAIYVVSKTEPITKHDSEAKDSPEFLRAVAQEEKDLGWCDYHVYLSPNNAMNGVVSLLSCTLHDRLRKVDPELAKQAQSPPSSARGLRLRGTQSSGLLE